MKDKLVKIQKVPLEGFIDTLIELYDRGAIFVDIFGTPDEDQETINLVVKMEYIDPENNQFDSAEEDIDDGFIMKIDEFYEDEEDNKKNNLTDLI